MDLFVVWGVSLRIFHEFLFGFYSLGTRHIQFYFIVSMYIHINIIDSNLNLEATLFYAHQKWSISTEPIRTAFERLRDHEVELDNLNECITYNGDARFFMYIGFVLKNRRKSRNAIVSLLKFHFIVILEFTCPPHFYGRNCSTPCGQCNGSAVCNNYVGYCFHGCKPHWNGLRCNGKKKNSEVF